MSAEFWNGILAEHAEGQRIAAKVSETVTPTRMARCMCGHTVPSKPDLAFFEDRGPMSRHAIELCHCGYYLHAHVQQHVARSCERVGKGQEARGPHEFDAYYCGCRGWD